MDQVLRDLPFCFVYVDNILIFSRDLSSQVDNLQEVFRLCQKHGWMIGLPKCEFAVSKIELLQHCSRVSELQPDLLSGLFALNNFLIMPI